MKRLFLAFVSIICLISVSASQGKKPGYNPANYPEVLKEEHFKNATELEKLHGFVDWDYRSKDMTQLSLEFLALQAFDQRTVWPEKNKRPEGFNPENWMETGKDPGLNVLELHQKGITGEGISVAIFDKYINPDHVEFSGRIILHRIRSPLAKDFQYRLHFHGIACASILCGKTLGIAPGAILHYFAVPDDGNNSYNYCLALEELLKINAELPASKRIRAVSISDGISRQDPAVYNKWQELVRKATEKRIAVIYSDSKTTHALFTWGGCSPFLDRNNPENYGYSLWPRNNDEKYAEKVILPSDYRTTAQNDGKAAYVYWGEGGFSWAIPYFVGMAALAWSLDEALTLEEILRMVENTKTKTSKGFYVINPMDFVNEIRKGKQ
jgi:hypothetical protein